MYNQLTKGFSLIELMVTIAILAVLVAVAIPAYSVYKSKATVNKVVRMAFETLSAAQIVYQETGYFPSSVSLGPITVTNSWSGTGAYQNFSYVFYNVSADGKGALLGVSVTGLSGLGNSYAGGSDPVGNFGQQTVYMAVRDTDEKIQYACGSYSPSYAYPNQGLSPSVLPESCTCDSMEQFLEGNYSC